MEFEDRVLMGIEEVEKFMFRSGVSLIDLKRDYNFPMHKREGLQSLSLKEFENWKAEWAIAPEINPREITTELLDQLFEIRQIETMEDCELNGTEAICNFLWRRPDEIIKFSRIADASPIKREGEQFVVHSMKELLRWLREMGLSRHGSAYQTPSPKPWELNGLR